MQQYNNFPYNYAENNRFIDRTIETDYVCIDLDTITCRSRIGKKPKGGKQVVRVGGCKVNDTLNFGKIMHELMHTAGMGQMDYCKITF